VLTALRKAARRGAAKRCVPEGVRGYAVGDVYGRDDLLTEAADQVEDDLGWSRSANALTVLLGITYVDRGPCSSQVLQRLSRSDWPQPFVALAGNHEDITPASWWRPACGRSRRKSAWPELSSIFSTGIGQGNTDASIITAADITISIISNRRGSLRVLGGCILLIRLAALIRANMFLAFY